MKDTFYTVHGNLVYVCVCVRIFSLKVQSFGSTCPSLQNDLNNNDGEFFLFVHYLQLLKC